MVSDDGGANIGKNVKRDEVNNEKKKKVYFERQITIVFKLLKPSFMEQKDILNSRATTARHPKALYILFFTEMWERFAYYLMVGILFLYLIDPTGKGFDQGLGADVVGSFIALVYLTPFIGGLLADRYIGYVRSIFIGGSLMAAGYLGLAFPGDTAMYI
ncbi:MAG TPA: hypothetical protein VL095_01775, partial [Flavisolibacter sp.]|nr:hypothetical protein [Flavisolibacter sp.]